MQDGVPTDQLTPFQARAAQVVRSIQTAICNGLETLEAEKGHYEGFTDDAFRATSRHPSAESLSFARA